MTRGRGPVRCDPQQPLRVCGRRLDLGRWARSARERVEGPLCERGVGCREFQPIGRPSVHGLSTNGAIRAGTRRHEPDGSVAKPQRRWHQVTPDGTKRTARASLVIMRSWVRFPHPALRNGGVSRCSPAFTIAQVSTQSGVRVEALSVGYRVGATCSVAIRVSTRARISSRMGRTASRSWPAGSSSSQSS